MLPSHWKNANLGEVADYFNGRAFKPKEWKEKGLPIIRIQNLNNEDSPYNFSDEIFEERYLVKQGELLFSWSASLGAYLWKGKDAWLNQHIFKVLPKNFIHKLYLYYYLEKVTKELYAKAHGSGMVHVTKKKFEETVIPLPPLPEQRAIVSKIEHLFSELDNGIANLKLIQEQLKVYRQAVLKKAFEGELTKKWREQQTDLQDARELLRQIRKEKEEDAKISGKKLTKVEPLTKDEISKLPRLPDKWLWIKFGEACNKIFDGTHFSPKNDSQGDFKYITAKNIKEGYLNLSDLSYVTKEDHYEIFSRCDVKKGDILYIKDGATAGKACVNPLEEEFSLLSSVGVFRVNEKYISPKFIEYYLNAEVTRHQMLKNVAGVAITRLTLVKLNNSMLILPPTEEQQAIVQEIETRLSVCDKIEQDIEVNLEKAEALRQSILKKAFEGKLLNENELAEVRGAEDWEPAEVLLERIKTERARNGKK